MISAQQQTALRFAIATCAAVFAAAPALAQQPSEPAAPAPAPTAAPAKPAAAEATSAPAPTQVPAAAAPTDAPAASTPAQAPAAPAPIAPPEAAPPAATAESTANAAPADTGAATAQAAPTAATAAPAGNPLLPEGEKEQTADRPLDNDRSRYRLGKGLEFDSADGEFSMVPRLRAQFLHTTEKAEGVDVQQGMQIRRARLQFTGHMWGKPNKYKVEFAVSPRDVATRETPGTSILLDWYMDFEQLRDASLRVGQYKVPFNRQRVISSGDLQLVDRSIVNSRLNVDRDIGLDLRSEDFLGLDMLKYYAGVFVGEGRNTFQNSDTGLMYLARVEFLPLGTDFKDYKEGDLERLQTPKLSIGLGTGYIDRAKYDRGILGSVPADGGTTDVTLLNADVMFKYAGFSLFSEYIMRSGERDVGEVVDEDAGVVVEDPAQDAYGLMVQGGYVLPRTNLEVVARWGMIEPLDDDSPVAPSGELGGGLSYYFAHHAFKLQGDYFRLTEGEGSAEVVSHEVRVQLQAAL